MERLSYASVTKCPSPPLFSEAAQVTPESPDNTPSTSDTKIHPLLQIVVLSKVLKFSHGHNDPKHFSSLRQVCKLWNTEVNTILRQTREIPIYRLFSPYPNGLNWKYNLQLDEDCYFRCPFPETLIFESLQMSGTCNAVCDIKTTRFFAVNGHHIKSLHFSSTLHCSHQLKFILNVLHTWCPNLETLHLSSIHRLSGLFNISKTTDEPLFDLKFNCGNLKTLILSIECSNNYLIKFPNCNSELDDELSDRVYFFVHILRVAHREFHEIKDKVAPEPHDKLTDNTTKFFQLLQSHIEKSLNAQNFPSGAQHFMYLGTLGHILRFAPLQKLVVRKLDSLDDSRSFAYFLLHHPSKPLTTLRHLEFGKAVLVGKDIASLNALSIPKTVLKTLKIENLASIRSNLEMFCKILDNCKDTLEHLRIGNNCDCCCYKRMPLELPKLPNLKTLAIKHINCFSVDGTKLFGNAPKLHKLEMMRDVKQKGNFDDVFVNTFCANFGKGGKKSPGFSLRELRYDGYLTNVNITDICSKRFGNLGRVELKVDSVANLERLVRCVGGNWGKLEDLRLSVGIASRSVYRKEMDRCIKLLRDELCLLQSLKFLDLAFRFRRRKIVLPVQVFTEGIQKMKGLLSLKFTNFRVLLENKEEIERCTAHIPYVSFLEMDYISKS